MGRKVANGSKQLKNGLINAIREMAEEPSLWAASPEKDFTRSRSLSFETVVRILLSMGGNSLDKEIRDFFKPDTLVTASAFVQARAKLLPEALSYLLHEFNASCVAEKLYNGKYRLLAADGTVMAYNGSPDDDTYMPNSGKGVNQFRANALFELLNHMYADMLVQPQPEANEPQAAWRMMERIALHEDAILIADRGYGGINLIEHLNRIPHAYYLIRIKNDLWKEIKDLPMADFDKDVEIHLRTTQTKADKDAYANGEAKWFPGQGKRKKLQTSHWDFESPYTVKVRIVRFQITEDTWETVATSLPRDEFPPTVLKYLYHLRWSIETSFRELKYAIGVTNFHSKKPESVLQEIFARTIMYNFCESITMHVVIEQDAGNKWTYQANHTMGVQICLDFFRVRGDPPDPPPDPEDEIPRYVVPVRPNRADRRKVDQKKAVYCISTIESLKGNNPISCKPRQSPWYFSMQRNIESSDERAPH